jgi:hypothetical protein
MGECVHLVFRIVSNMFLRQKLDLTFEPGPSLKSDVIVTARLRVSAGKVMLQMT